MMNLENCITVNAPGFENVEDQKLKAQNRVRTERKMSLLVKCQVALASIG